MYILSGFHDSQVQYWEPAKWAAKLREMKTSDSLVLFECDMASGHGGPSGRYRGIKRTARVWAFMLDLTGIKE
jgi:oligopeptidase B